MTNSKNYFTYRVIALVLAFSFLISTCFIKTPVMGAVSGYGQSTKKVFVQTKADWSRPGTESITFGNRKIKFKYISWFKTKYRNAYPKWHIEYKSTDGKHRGSTTMSGASKKINLKRNKSYNITISYDTYNWIQKGTAVTTPSWYVKSSCKATYS